jgi:hypothetical protein
VRVHAPGHVDGPQGWASEEAGHSWDGEDDGWIGEVVQCTKNGICVQPEAEEGVREVDLPDWYSVSALDGRLLTDCQLYWSPSPWQALMVS